MNLFISLSILSETTALTDFVINRIRFMLGLLERPGDYAHSKIHVLNRIIIRLLFVGI